MFWNVCVHHIDQIRTANFHCVGPLQKWLELWHFGKFYQNVRKFHQILKLKVLIDWDVRLYDQKYLGF